MSNELSVSVIELMPEGLTPNTASRQESKSSRTREAILDSALDCIAEHGYANTTHNLICQHAKVSRGALLHHYPTSQDLMEAVIDYAFYKHMAAFSEMVGKLSEVERRERNTAIGIDWALCKSREMLVYLDLRVASRTDADLKSIFVPRARHHDLVWKEELLKVFPEWRNDLHKLDLTRRLTRAILEGLAMSRDLWRDTDAEWTLLAFTANFVKKIRVGELEFPAPTEVAEFQELASAIKKPRATRLSTQVPAATKAKSTRTKK